MAQDSGRDALMDRLDEMTAQLLDQSVRIARLEAVVRHALKINLGPADEPPESG